MKHSIISNTYKFITNTNKKYLTSISIVFKYHIHQHFEIVVVIRLVATYSVTNR